MSDNFEKQFLVTYCSGIKLKIALMVK